MRDAIATRAIFLYAVVFTQKRKLAALGNVQCIVTREIDAFSPTTRAFSLPLEGDIPSSK